MSASSKTEKPTEKKKADESKKGKSWRSQDLVALIVLFGGALYLRHLLSLYDVMAIMLGAAENGFVVPLSDYTTQHVKRFLLIVSGLLASVFVLAVTPNLLMSRFRLAPKAVRLDFAAINPVSGFKRIFSLKTFKDALKACAYLGAYALAGALFWHTQRMQIVGLSSLAPRNMLSALADLGFSLVMTLLGVTLILALADAFMEYLLYIRDLKMTREEVKRENKDQNGAPEVKQQQRRLGQELLSGETMGDVERSTFIVANPTHIAVGMYLNPDIAPMPFVSVMEIDERALAVIAHAKKMGIPVIQHIGLARKLLKTNKRYTFVSAAYINEVTEVLMWLVEVEATRRAQYEAAESGAEENGTAEGDGRTAETDADVAPEGQAPNRADGASGTEVTGS